MTLYVIRHGQTDWNAERRLQGQKDIPLNDFGRSQAAENGVKLKALEEDLGRFAFISSPLGRARETMEIVRGSAGLTPSPYELDDRLREISFGDWEGFTLKELSARVPQDVKRRRTEKWDFLPPGKDAESYEILCRRVGAWFREVERPTVVVCHGGVVRCILRIVAGIDKQEAADMPIPQEKFLRIDAGRTDWI